MKKRAGKHAGKVAPPEPPVCIMDATDQPLWRIERWWESKGWEISELQTMEIVGQSLACVRP
jgi:hypothetical protein